MVVELSYLSYLSRIIKVTQSEVLDRTSLAGWLLRKVFKIALHKNYLSVFATTTTVRVLTQNLNLIRARHLTVYKKLNPFYWQVKNLVLMEDKENALGHTSPVLVNCWRPAVRRSNTAFQEATFPLPLCFPPLLSPIPSHSDVNNNITGLLALFGYQCVDFPCVDICDSFFSGTHQVIPEATFEVSLDCLGFSTFPCPRSPLNFSPTICFHLFSSSFYLKA